MTMIARFSRAGTDDATFEAEVEDIVFDFDCVEDATTGMTIAAVEERPGGGLRFLPVNAPQENGWFDTLTVVPKHVPQPLDQPVIDRASTRAKAIELLLYEANPMYHPIYNIGDMEMHARQVEARVRAEVVREMVEAATKVGEKPR